MEDLTCFEDVGALKEVLPIFLKKHGLFEEFKKMFKEHTLKGKGDIYGNESETAASEDIVSKSTKRKKFLGEASTKEQHLERIFQISDIFVQIKCPSRPQSSRGYYC